MLRASQRGPIRLARAVLLFTLVMPSVALAQQTAAPGQSSATMTRPSTDQVQDRIKALALRKAREGWRFDIGSTALMAFATPELTGAEKGLPSPAHQAARRAFAIKALALNEKAKQRAGIKPVDLGVTCRPSDAAFNWHKPGFVYPPRSQVIEHGASCGSCWAFAATAAYESSYLIENATRSNASPLAVEASEQRLLNCTPDSSCMLGHIARTFDLLVLQGTTNRNDQRYLASKLPCLPPDLPTDKIQYHAVAWGPILQDSSEVAPPARIKDVLCTFGPVTSRIMANDNLKIHSGSAAFHEVDPVKVTDNDAHHLVIVGWDDSKGTKGAWLVKNSWGDKWGMFQEGMPGYAWIEYGANLIGHHANWVKAFHRKVAAEDLGPEYVTLKKKYLASTP